MIMQIGARWSHGEAPHRSVPEGLHGILREAEEQFPTGEAWQLTWLEGRPVCELDDRVTVTTDSSGTPMMIHAAAAHVDEDEDDGWLSDA